MIPTEIIEIFVWLLLLITITRLLVTRWNLKRQLAWIKGELELERASWETERNETIKYYSELEEAMRLGYEELIDDLKRRLEECHKLNT